MSNQTFQIQIRLRASSPQEKEKAISLIAESERDISEALLSLIHTLFNELAKRGHINNICRENNLTKYLKTETHKEKTEQDFVQETIDVLTKYGWHGKLGAPAWAWTDFRNIPKEEYTDYLKTVKELLPNGSTLYEQLKIDFDEGLVNPKQGVRYRYLCELIASIAYVSASGYLSVKESEENNGNQSK